MAHRLNRRWIGIDITHLAINLIKHRLVDAFGDKILEQVHVKGEPTDFAGAAVLAAQDPYQFQWWALGLVGARPADPKKGADRGIDGRLYFHDEKGLKTKQIIFQVKAGHTGVRDVRDLRGVLEREKAALGVLITLLEPTKDMRREAASIGFYDSPWGTRHPKLQILMIEELLEGKQVNYPRTPGGNVTLKKAPRAKRAQSVSLKLPLGE